MSEEQTAAPAQGTAAFRRVLLKLSGEALMGGREYGVDLRTVEAVAGEIVAWISEIAFAGIPMHRACSSISATLVDSYTQ